MAVLYCASCRTPTIIVKDEKVRPCGVCKGVQFSYAPLRRIIPKLELTFNDRKFLARLGIAAWDGELVSVSKGSHD